MQGKALVFSGGGAKGAYEAGVWKAMREKHLDQQIHMVAGTSAGSLNAVLFAQGNLEEALSVWSTIHNSQILTVNNLCETSACKMTDEEKLSLCAHLMDEMKLPFAQIGIFQKLAAFTYQRLLARYISKMEKTLSFSLAKAVVPCFLNILSELKQTQDFDMAVKNTIYFIGNMIRDGLFSQEGLKQILNEHYHPQELLRSSVLSNATAFDISKLRLKHFDLTASNQSIHKDILLASSAIPVVFDPVHIDGDVYVDGGIPYLGDNTPIDVVYQRGYRDIIAVILNADEVDVKKYSDANIVIVQPQASLGSALASLDFDETYTKKLIQLGYEDGLRIL